MSWCDSILFGQEADIYDQKVNQKQANHVKNGLKKDVENCLEREIYEKGVNDGWDKWKRGQKSPNCCNHKVIIFCKVGFLGAIDAHHFTMRINNSGGFT